MMLPEHPIGGAESLGWSANERDRLGEACDQYDRFTEPESVGRLED
jgi:hypothetical protein